MQITSANTPSTNLDEKKVGQVLIVKKNTTTNEHVAQHHPSVHDPTHHCLFLQLNMVHQANPQNQDVKTSVHCLKYNLYMSELHSEKNKPPPTFNLLFGGLRDKKTKRIAKLNVIRQHTHPHTHSLRTPLRKEGLNSPPIGLIKGNQRFPKPLRMSYLSGDGFFNPRRRRCM